MMAGKVLLKGEKKKALPMGGKSGKKKYKQTNTIKPKISLFSLSNFSNNVALSLSLYSGTAHRRRFLSFSSLSGIILSLSSLS